MDAWIQLIVPAVSLVIAVVSAALSYYFSKKKSIAWPKNNSDFWRTKITSNTERDKQNHIRLQELGWNVIVIWECSLKRNLLEKTLADLVTLLQKTLPSVKA